MPFLENRTYYRHEIPRGYSIPVTAFYGTFFAVGRTPTWFSPSFMPEEQAQYVSTAKKSHVFEIYNSFVDPRHGDGLYSKIVWKAHTIPIHDSRGQSNIDFRVESDVEEKFREVLPDFLIKGFESLMPESDRSRANFRIMYVDIQDGKIQAAIVFGAQYDTRYHWALMRADKIKELGVIQYNAYIAQLKAIMWTCLMHDNQITTAEWQANETGKNHIMRGMMWFSYQGISNSMIETIHKKETMLEARSANARLEAGIADIYEERRRRSTMRRPSSASTPSGTQVQSSMAADAYSDRDSAYQSAMSEMDRIEKGMAHHVYGVAGYGHGTGDNPYVVQGDASSIDMYSDDDVVPIPDEQTDYERAVRTSDDMTQAFFEALHA